MPPVQRISALLALAACLLSPVPAWAHDIPSDVRIQAFLKPEGQRLRLIVRAPVAAMNDIEWPTDGLRLDLARVEGPLRAAATEWVARRVDLYEGSRLLETPRIANVRVSLPSDASFDHYETAVAHVTGPPLPKDADVIAGQALLDVMLEYRIDSDQSRFSIDPRFGMLGLRTLTVLRFFSPGNASDGSGIERAFQFHDDPGLVRLDPQWFQAAARFVADGFFHILGGIDHLLFLLCLVIPFRRFRALVPIITAFTVAHSITLIASAYDMAPGALWFPPLVETLIAASIVYMALENIVAPGLRRRWMVAFGFGLVHGFGFSFALRESLQFAGNHLLTSLLSFNIGVEIGQMLVLVATIPLLDALFRFVTAERVVTILLSAFVAHTGWHWMTERTGRLMLYQFQLPVFDAAFFSLAMQWLMIAVATSAVFWLIRVIRTQRSARQNAGTRPGACA
jgi:hypothetical protein